MIDRLTIRDFQKHKILKLKLEGVTTIIGDNDIGKSAIVRAIRWICMNQPRGEAFIRNGQSKVAVAARVDGHKIKRVRGKSNTYELDGVSFSAFGTGVPDEVQEVLNVQEINFQGQHDNAFWFSLSPGDISRQLNEIIDLSIIDSTMAHISSGVRKTRSEASVVEKRLGAAQEERRALKGVVGANKALQAIEEQSQDIDDRFNRRKELIMLKKHALNMASIERNSRNELRWATQLTKHADSWELSMRRRVGLSNAIIKANDLSRIAARKIPSTTALSVMAKQQKTIHAEITRISEEVSSFLEFSARLKKANKELKAAKLELQELMGDDCPLCGRSNGTTS